MSQDQAGASAPFTGGCACGAVRYEIVGEPVLMFHCQCRQCQRDSGAGHGSHIAFSGARVSIAGSPSRWDLVGDRGNRKTRSFCGVCGAPLFLTSPDKPELFSISPASLDDPGRFAPQVLLWTDAAHPWDHTDPALPSFGKMPPGV
jgi:hypothetical protein